MNKVSKSMCGVVKGMDTALVDGCKQNHCSHGQIEKQFEDLGVGSRAWRRNLRGDGGLDPERTSTA